MFFFQILMQIKNYYRGRFWLRLLLAACDINLDK